MEAIILSRGKVELTRYARILSTGMYLPEKKETNEETGKRIEFDVDGWLRPRTGITLRHLSAPNESTSDMAAQASLQALKNAHLKPEDLDLIILATDTPDFVSPPTSAVIQYKIGAKNAGCFDVNAACSDVPIALTITSQQIMNDPSVKYALVTGSYGMTKWLDWKDKWLAPLFSDGAGAVILGASDEPGFIASKTIADGSYWDCYGIYVGTAYPVSLQMVQENRHHLRFHESGHRYPADVNLARWPQLIIDTTRKAGYEVRDLDMVLMTQVNVNTIKDVMKILDLPLSKTHWIMDKYGYNGSACVIFALHDALAEGKIKKGDLLCICASGVGYVMSAVIFRWI
jgi:3-oxoacyl-[acyl-carrier-protein] synthase-3